MNINCRLLAVFILIALTSISANSNQESSNKPHFSSVDEIDLSRIKLRLIEKLDWSSEFADRVIVEYKRFLELHQKFPDFYIVPSLDVDEVWHAHILHTAQYYEDCTKLFGEILHHDPMSNDEKEEDGGHSYDNFLKLYEQEFGKAGEIWKHDYSNGNGTEAGPCGSCSSCSSATKKKEKKGKEKDGGCGSCSGSCGGAKKGKGKNKEKDGGCGSCGGGCGANKGKKGKKEEKGGDCGSCSGGCGAKKKEKKGGCGSCSGGCGAKKKAKEGKGTGCGSGCGAKKEEKDPSKKEGKDGKGTGCGSGCGAKKEGKDGKGTGCGSGCGAKKEGKDGKGKDGKGKDGKGTGCGSGCGAKKDAKKDESSIVSNSQNGDGSINIPLP